MTWPKVFDGIGALVVNCALDPDKLADSIPGLTWIAPKFGGTDIAPWPETAHCIDRWRARGLTVGAWCYCDGPPVSDAQLVTWADAAFVIYDVEAEYKTDGGAPATWPAELVAAHRSQWPQGFPGAVTSYGAIPGYGNMPSSIDFHPFAVAGWPILAQIYDSFQPGAEITYMTTSGKAFPGPYAPAGVHRVFRSLTVSSGEVVYRPEGLDS